ncbi:hypothetical protein BTA51_03715 [Hahella sp. CCB-MM4]|uniref:MaoC family dehydratase n=1 Tax=Hahella sp. (strain CCB-MM4) TaxID=1926491 RepID=UPI000B9B21B1|nr:MaoC/PaaZ C-terminal domain-containing protein [Hahella sp. CCB-MM4]OZG74141.1 hypothetical protein BTA51_03715 [Hahella sp. CCB-MM4]
MSAIPYSLILQQGPMMRAFARVVARELIPGLRSSTNPVEFEVLRRTVKAPDNTLVERYIQWSGAEHNLYQDKLPAHLFAYYGLPLITQSLLRTRYRISSAINQGCDIRVNRLLERGRDIHLQLEIKDIREAEGRARVHGQFVMGHSPGQDHLVIDVYIAFIIGQSRESKKPGSGISDSDIELVSSWDVSGDDGLYFAFLTGDFNPIHWATPVAKRSVFKGKVLHGYGMMAKCYEAIQNHEGRLIKSLRVKFLKPVFLPSKNNKVFRSAVLQTDERRGLILKDAGGQMLMVGDYVS